MNLTDFSALIKPRPYDRAWAQDANFCIMPSLGYSDYCILLAERDWHFAPVLIEFLHRAGYEGKDARPLVPIYSCRRILSRRTSSISSHASSSRVWLPASTVNFRMAGAALFLI